MTDTETAKPKKFQLPIQGGLLDNLGINMYANLGKCLVEFAANAYDSDSTFVEIVLDSDAIVEAREQVRRAAVAAAKRSGSRPPAFVEDPLPSDLSVVVRDGGHGMNPEDVQKKFLPINRNRRRKEAGAEETLPKSEAGKRFVMGRKGIGKLSGFGAASTLTVRTKREGDTFATVFRLELSALRNMESLAEVTIPAEYIEGLPANEHGTELTLTNLKCDSMKFSEADLVEALAEAFYPVRASEFSIKINGVNIDRTEPEWAFQWPDPSGGEELGKVGSPDTGELDFTYAAKFRKRSLPASKRGARVYCNGRLAFGPSLMSLNTGSHNFMAHQYLEMIVEADDLDRLNVDLISTDRGEIRRNNDLVEAFLQEVSDLMQKAIAAHAKFREGEAEVEFENAPEAASVREIVASMPPRQRVAGRKIVNVIVSRFGVDSPEFGTIAPLLVQSMNAGEVLIDLIRIANNPKDIEEISRHLVELREIERGDALKIYRGRRSGISALRTLTDRGEENWQKGKRSEGKLQDLLKDAPWLIKPELSSYVSSDKSMDKVVSVLAKELGVDEFAASSAESPESSDNKRPDLVFLLGDAPSAEKILVVELKSPNIPLDVTHLQQLKSYIRKIEKWLSTEHAGQPRRWQVEGILIGAMPAIDTKSEGALGLIDDIDKRGIRDQWEVVGLRELLARTEAVHRELISALAYEPDEPLEPPMLVAGQAALEGDRSTASESK